MKGKVIVLLLAILIPCSVCMYILFFRLSEAYSLGFQVSLTIMTLVIHALVAMIGKNTKLNRVMFYGSCLGLLGIWVFFILKSYELVSWSWSVALGLAELRVIVRLFSRSSSRLSTTTPTEGTSTALTTQSSRLPTKR